MAAVVAACSERGLRPSNEDACLAEVAETGLGEVGLVAVCDGVGGLERGALASSTVAAGLSRWFEEELPTLVAGPARGGALDCGAVEASWEALLARLDGALASHACSQGCRMATTFTAVLSCAGSHLVGHVGDCRAYLVASGRARQLTCDQVGPPVGQASDGAARRAHGLLQAVGVGRGLRPAFFTGRHGPGDLLVVCSDGAWRRAGAGGVAWAFAEADPCDEQALEAGCRRLVRLGLSRGERDNLTVACLSPGGGSPCAEPATMALDVRPDEAGTVLSGGAS